MIDADTLLGLQQAYADLSKLLDDARILAELRPWIEKAVQPKLFELGRRLRRLQWTSPADTGIEDLVQEIRDWQARIRQRAEAIWNGATFEKARSAFRQRNFRLLEEQLPQLFADLEQRLRPNFLLVPFDPMRPRRRPGQAPFMSPPELASEFEKVFAEGLVLRAPESPPWAAEFPYVLVASDPDILASPVWLVCHGPTLPAAVLADLSEPGAWRAYADVLQGFTAVGVGETVEDEWWLVQDQPFSEYRAQLESALRARGIECVPGNAVATAN